MANIDRGEWNPNLVYNGTNDGTNFTGGDTVYWMGATFGATYYTIDSNPYYQTGWKLISGTVNTQPSVPSPIAALGSTPAMVLSASSDHSLTVSWNAAKVAGAGEVSSYNILVNGTQVGTTTGSGTSFTVSNLAAATSYQIQVTATDAYGTSGPNPVYPVGSSTNVNTAPGQNPVFTFMTAGSHINTGKYFTPYIDVGLPGYDLYNVSKSSGLTSFTLAFQNSSYANLDPANYISNANGSMPTLLAGRGPAISFGGLAAVNTPTGVLIDEINQIQHAEGGTITASIGGYTGIDPAVIAGQYATYLQTSAGGGLSAAAANAKAAAALQGSLQSVMNTFGLTHLDFDIETEQSYTYTDSTGTHFTNDPTSVSNAVSHQYTVANDTAANALRNTAIVALEAANPGMGVTFTVATNTTGLGSSTSSYGGDVLDLVKIAIQSGVRIDALNLMVMDFDAGDTGAGANASQADKAIAAANAVHAQFPNLKIALTPMIGQNDSNSGVTSLADTVKIAAFVNANSWIVGTGEWQLGRDQYAATAASTSVVQTYQSGVAQSQWQFSSILKGTTSLNRAALTSDHNGDGTSDVLLQNGGTVVDWTMSNGVYQSGSTITTAATGYKVVAKGDFNGDGTTDVLLQNGGTVVEWIMKNGAYQSGSTITTGAGAFKVVGVGDFNGDGTSDILLQNGDTVVEWFMKNGAYQSSSTITGAGAFKVVGVGDFNGDGTSDIVLQNGATVVDWIIQNGAVQSSNVITTGATGYAVVGTGDYNGDGISDILVQNGGTVSDWIMLAGQYSTGHVITTGASGFSVV